MVGAHRVGSALILVPLAAVLGVAPISGEVSKGTIFLALSRPISRDRLLLIKYATGAGILLIVALVGSAGLIVSAHIHGYPSSSFVITNILLSAILIWLGSLCVLGTALLLSVVFGDVIRSVIATGLAVYVILKFPRDFLNYSLWVEHHRLGVPERLVDRLRLPHYWSSEGLYSGDSFAVTNFLVCSIAAALPLLAALWLFRRKEY